MRLVAILTIVISAAFSVAAQNDIHAVDFRNFTYSAYCAGEEPEKITVKDGEYSKETQMEGYVDQVWFRVFSIKYGDLNSDKDDEAVVLSTCNTGGTGFFTEGFIYSMQSGKPILLARIPGGDRAFGGLREATVENGILIVKRNDAGEDGGACCPQFILTERYHLGANDIQEIGKIERRPFVDTERITFTKGSSSKTFKVTLAAGESKRYVVGARAGQKLTVFVNNNKIVVTLLEGSDDSSESNHLSVDLTKTGDHTIEVRNNNESDIEITLEIKIQ